MSKPSIVLLHRGFIADVDGDVEVIHLDVLLDDWHSDEDARRAWADMSPEARRLARRYFKAERVRFSDALYRKVIR